MPESYRPYLEKYDWNVDLAIEVIRYESGGYSDITNWNDKHRGCVGSAGLFQIACLHTGELEYDIETNIELAWKIYQDGKWSAWGACDFEASCGKLLALVD